LHQASLPCSLTRARRLAHKRYKGNDEGLAELFASGGEDEAARRERAELRVQCYEDAKATCVQVQRGLVQ
jgi:hypothetical protein